MLRRTFLGLLSCLPFIGKITEALPVYPNPNYPATYGIPYIETNTSVGTWMGINRSEEEAYKEKLFKSLREFNSEWHY